MLRGNLAPDGAVIKPPAAERAAARSTPGRAVVFDDYDDMAARIDDPDARRRRATPCSCCKNAGPLGAPGHAGVGQLPIPKKLLQQGVRDMVRISDARMSGTSYGACVLHVAPESYVGGPLALVRDGDVIELDVPARKLHAAVSDDELARAPRGVEAAAAASIERGYGALFLRAHHAGRQGLRLRLPRDGGTVDARDEPEIH